MKMGTDWVSLASSSSCCSPRPYQALPNDRFWSGAARPAAQHRSDLNSWKTFLVGINRGRTSGFSRKASQDPASEGRRQSSGWDCYLAQQDGVDAEVPGTLEA